MFRPVQLEVLAAKGKTGSGSLIEEVTLTGVGSVKMPPDHCSVLKLYLCQFSDLRSW